MDNSCLYEPRRSDIDQGRHRSGPLAVPFVTQAQ